MSKSQQALEVIKHLLQKRRTIDLQDDIFPAFKRRPQLNRYRTFAVWNAKRAGLMRPLGHGVYRRV
jgi:hypothetical protein